MRHIVSNIAELAGVAAVIVGIWMGVGIPAALIAAGVAAVAYAWRLDR